MKTIILSAGLMLAISTNLAGAQNYESTSVRQAAIERLQSKLGGLRGPIQRDNPRIFLTESMIEQLKPISKDSHKRAAALEADKQNSSVISLAISEPSQADSSVITLKNDDSIVAPAEKPSVDLVQSALDLSANNLEAGVDYDAITGSIEKPNIEPDPKPEQHTIEAVVGLQQDTKHEDQFFGSVSDH